MIWIPKSDKTLDCPTAYRPITLLSIIGKILERMIATRIKAHIETQLILSDIKKKIDLTDAIHCIVEEINISRKTH